MCKKYYSPLTKKREDRTIKKEHKRRYCLTILVIPLDVLMIYIPAV